jgi:hypothetical protein
MTSLLCALFQGRWIHQSIHLSSKNPPHAHIPRHFIATLAVETSHQCGDIPHCKCLRVENVMCFLILMKILWNQLQGGLKYTHRRAATTGKYNDIFMNDAASPWTDVRVTGYPPNYATHSMPVFSWRLLSAGIRLYIVQKNVNSKNRLQARTRWSNLLWSACSLIVLQKSCWVLPLALLPWEISPSPSVSQQSPTGSHTAWFLYLCSHLTM